MKSGYDQFFKKARQAAVPGMPVGIAKKSTPTQMAEKLRAKLAVPAKKKIRKGISWKLAGLSFAGLLLALLGMQYHDKIEKFVKNIEISLGTAMAEEKTATPAKKDDKALSAADATKTTGTKAENVLAVKKDYSQENF